MANQDIALMAHLIRRAGFGATRDEIEAYVAKGYEAVVEELLDTDAEPASDRFTMMRFQPQFYKPGTIQGMGGAEWVHNMVNTKRPLEEKMALFWHGLFAAGVSKVDHYDEVMSMIYKFREYGLGDYRELLLQMAKDPSMIYWLDNCENHVDAVNENWGRELLELFSMGVGNYTEVDVRDCSRAFTGWTFEPKLPRFPIGRFEWSFQYREDDHDDTEKTFLGQTGNFDGEDIIRIISENPACAKFIARHLYSYFVADEVQVPAWSVTPPRDPEAVDLLANTLMNNDYDIRSTLRVLFNSEFFKNARFERLKNPAEVVIGALRMVGGSEFPAPGIGELASQPKYMGQDLLNPPSVEGWHTGAEWINSGSLMRRINFTAELVGDVSRPGIKNMVDRLIAKGDTSAEAVVDSCLDLMGPLEVNPESLTELNGFVTKGGDFAWDSEADIEKSTSRVSALLQLIVSLREFQYA
jgi:uncharacterized protein (DUF1800 family)